MSILHEAHDSQTIHNINLLSNIYSVTDQGIDVQNEFIFIMRCEFEAQSCRQHM